MRKINKIFASIIIVYVFTVNLSAQNRTSSFGVNVGLSSFESLSTTVSGVQLGGFFEFPVWFSKAFNMQAGIFYIRKPEFFLPDNSAGKYYPYFYGASLNGVMRQRLQSVFFAEEQAGLMIMKNKFFQTIDETNYGVNFGLGGGIDLTIDGKGFLLSICYKGGLTFNQSTPTFNSFLLQAQIVY